MSDNIRDIELGDVHLHFLKVITQELIDEALQFKEKSSITASAFNYYDVESGKFVQVQINVTNDPDEYIYGFDRVVTDHSSIYIEKNEK